MRKIGVVLITKDVNGDEVRHHIMDISSEHIMDTRLQVRLGVEERLSRSGHAKCGKCSGWGSEKLLPYQGYRICSECYAEIKEMYTL